MLRDRGLAGIPTPEHLARQRLGRIEHLPLQRARRVEANPKHRRRLSITDTDDVDPTLVGL